MDNTGATCRLFVIFLGIACQVIHGDDDCVSSTSRSSFQLSCSKSGGQIVLVDIQSGKGNCRYRHTAKCVGESASLLVAKHKCYWHPNCTVEFPNDVIIRVPEDTGTENCYGIFPQFMQLNEYRCFTQILGASDSSNLLDICATSGTEIAYEYGLIRSHEYYPWLYDPREMRRMSCSVEIYGRPGYQLLVSVLDIEVGEDDKLVMVTDKNKVISLESKTSEATVSGKVKINFTLGKYSNGGRGFLICFKFIGENDRVKNACDDLTQKGVIFPPKMVSDEPTTTTASTTTTPSTTTAKVCRNRRGKVKRCRRKKPRDPNKRRKGKKPKKSRKPKEDRKGEKRNKKNKKRRQAED